MSTEQIGCCGQSYHVASRLNALIDLVAILRTGVVAYSMLLSPRFTVYRLFFSTQKKSYQCTCTGSRGTLCTAYLSTQPGYIPVFYFYELMSLLNDSKDSLLI